jgi:hypothetical protein
VLQFPRRGARSYRLQFRDTLATNPPSDWRELMTFPAEAGPSAGIFRDLTTTNANRFYRVATP